MYLMKWPVSVLKKIYSSQVGSIVISTLYIVYSETKHHATKHKDKTKPRTKVQTGRHNAKQQLNISYNMKK